MLLRDLQERVWARMTPTESACERRFCDDAVRAAVEEMGMGVTDAGVIYRPQPQPRQQNTHWRGSKRKR